MDDFLKLIIIGIVFIIIILIGVLVYMWIKERTSKNNNTNTPNAKKDDEIEERKARKSIFKFMEFDTIEDNMIVQDNGKRYLMVIECKGVNYDLLSNVEKNSIEQGFIGFLNALKFEIQLYVQTRKVNLAQSTMKYRERLRMIEMDMRDEEAKYEDMQRSGDYTKEEILKELKEVTKKRNLYDYSKDVIENTEQMSSDSDLTTKEYYIVVPYYTDEITSGGEYDKREIGSMAFSELYTRAQSLVNALSECDVRGKILNSQELVELLFISYNREQHDIYDFDEYMSQSSYNSFYTVTQDVLEKRMEAIDEEILKKANEKALDAYKRANKKVIETRKVIEDREKRMQEYIDAVAEDLLDSQENVLGEHMVQKSKEEIKIMSEEKRQRSINLEHDNQDKNIDVKQKKKKKWSELTEEEKKKVKAKMLKKKKLLADQEAKKNEEN